MAFKLLKLLAALTVGMMLAPKKGFDLRQDFLELIKKYKPQLQKIVNNIEVVWEKTQGIESDEVSADIELKIKDVKAAVDILDSATTKEMAYKTLKKVDHSVVKLIKASAKSPNIRAVAKDLAKITVSVIGESVKIADDIQKRSATISEKVVETGQQQQQKKSKISSN